MGLLGTLEIIQQYILNLQMGSPLIQATKFSIMYTLRTESSHVSIPVQGFV